MSEEWLERYWELRHEMGQLAMGERSIDETSRAHLRAVADLAE